MVATRTYTLTALTDIWTGDASGKGGRLITTGLLGSIRWWFEVVVRGLGGSACDPTHQKDNKPGPCPQPGKGPHDAGHHCVVCELFGCTDWARKFRFDVLDGSGKPQQNQIKARQQFQFRFTSLRPICEQEWALLDLTIRLIAEYGAIGGKTVSTHHDYGLVGVEKLNTSGIKRQQLERYVGNNRWRSVDEESFRWASLKHFWFVGKGQLKPEWRVKILGANTWLKDKRGVSTKIFSFNCPKSAGRTFGFMQSQDRLGEMRQHLRKHAWNDLKDDEFVTGPEILRRLLGQGGDA